MTVKPGPSALLSPVAAFITLAVAWAVARAGADLAAGDQIGAFWLLVVSVSYTHLTLPTNREV